VAALHDPSGRAAFVHRDIKTANVLLDGDMRAFVGDFGLVRELPGLTSSGGTGRTHMSTANLIGTHQYMPPEYLEFGEIGPKTDVWSCGVVALELLTGRPSRPNGDASQDLRRMMDDLLEDLQVWLGCTSFAAPFIQFIPDLLGTIHPIYTRFTGRVGGSAL
jgi:serine/threonine protein kinase